jgi:hypothetical protein
MVMDRKQSQENIVTNEKQKMHGTAHNSSHALQAAAPGIRVSAEAAGRAPEASLIRSECTAGTGAGSEATADQHCLRTFVHARHEAERAPVSHHERARLD